MGTLEHRSAFTHDARTWQIAALAGLLAYGLLALGFDLRAPQIVVTLAVALAAQWAASRSTRVARFEPRSALISALSLCLLLRTDRLWVAALAAAVAILSKFVVRVRGKHVFNPTNLALVAALLFTRHAWVSPGQWGHFAYFTFLIACAGGWVVYRALRSDVTLAFLASYAAILFGRMAWLGQKPPAPLHQFESGALLLFAFFMISDPRTTPDSRTGRVIFGVLVAAVASFITFRLFRPNGLLLALVVVSPLTPLIDRWLPGRRHQWSPPHLAPGTQTQEEFHETSAPRTRRRARARAGIAASSA